MIQARQWWKSSKEDVSVLGITETGDELCDGFEKSRFDKFFTDTKCRALGPIRIIRGERQLTEKEGFKAVNYFYFDRFYYNVSRDSIFDLFSFYLAPLKGFDLADEERVSSLGLDAKYVLEMPGGIKTKDENCKLLDYNKVEVDLVEMVSGEKKTVSVSSEKSRFKFVASVTLFVVIAILIMLIWSFYFYMKKKAPPFE